MDSDITDTGNLCIRVVSFNLHGYKNNWDFLQQLLSSVMIVCLFALMIVLLIYCVLSVFVILINIILVMSDVDYYYYLYSLYVATLCIERDT